MTEPSPQLSSLAQQRVETQTFSDLNSLLERNRAWLFTALILLFAIQVSGSWYPTPDSVSYLSIARNIAGGNGLLNLGNRHLSYPPGFPLLISPAFLFSARPFLVISFIQFLLAIALVFGIYRWLSLRRDVPAALLTALCAVNVSLWIYFRRPLSELAFTSAIVWSANFLDSDDTNSPARFAPLIGASLIREVGAVFAVAFALSTFLRGSLTRSRMLMGLLALAGTAAAVGAFVAYDIQTASHSPTAVGSHLAGFLDFRSRPGPRVTEGVRLAISGIGRLLVPGMFKSYGRRGQWMNVNMLVYLPILAIVLLGWLRMVREDPNTLAVGAPLYFAVYILWAFDADTRYVLPLIPLLAACLWLGAAGLPRRDLLFAGAAFAHLAVAIGFWLAIDSPRAKVCAGYQPAVESFAQKIAAQSAPVGFIDSPECVQPMLEFVLDRPARRVDDLSNANEQWLISAGEQPSGFERAADDGSLTLWRRR